MGQRAGEVLGQEALGVPVEMAKQRTRHVLPLARSDTHLNRRAQASEHQLADAQQRKQRDALQRLEAPQTARPAPS